MLNCKPKVCPITMMLSRWATARPAKRPTVPFCHAPVTLNGWGTWLWNGQLKLWASTFLNTLRTAPEAIARNPNSKPTFYHALSRTCHNPIMTKSMLFLVTTKSMIILVTTKYMLILVTTKSMLILVMTKISINLVRTLAVPAGHAHVVNY